MGGAWGALASGGCFLVIYSSYIISLCSPWSPVLVAGVCVHFYHSFQSHVRGTLLSPHLIFCVLLIALFCIKEQEA